MNDIEITDQTSALRWILDNRRSDVSFEEALQRLRIALFDDTQAQSILDRLAQSPASQ